MANDEVGTRLLRAVEGELVPSGMGLRSLAATAAQWVFARPSLYGIVRAMPFLKLGETIYHDVESTGAMAPVNAGILGRTWHSALVETAARRRTADTLLNVLLAGTAFKPITERYGTAGYLRLSALADSAALDSVGSAEAGRLGVMPGYPKTLATLPGFEAKCVIAQSLAGSRILAERLVTFPTHGLLSEGDIERLCAWIKRVECAAVGQPAERAEIPVGRH